MRVYVIDSGRLYEDTPTGLTYIASGSSGFEDAANDPHRVGEKGVGPLPPGAYVIGDPYHHPELGPVVMNLVPAQKTDVLGRDGLTFRIHGMSKLGARESSHGCLIFGPAERQVIAAGSRQLLVLSTLSINAYTV